jgi:hypothetical protein
MLAIDAVNWIAQMQLCISAPKDCDESRWPQKIEADPDIAGIGV